MPSPSSTGEHPGARAVNLSASRIRDTSSVTTQDPGGIRRAAAAIVAGLTSGLSPFSAANPAAAHTPRMTAATAATARAGQPGPAAGRAGEPVIAAASVASGIAMARPRNGARNAQKW